MTEELLKSCDGRRTWAPTILGAVLLLGAWGAEFRGHYRVEQLDLSQFGPCPDIPDALRRDGYVAAHLSPYFAAAAGLDLAAVGVSIWAMVPVLATIIAGLSMLSAQWHGFGWFMLSSPFF